MDSEALWFVPGHEVRWVSVHSQGLPAQVTHIGPGMPASNAVLIGFVNPCTSLQPAVVEKRVEVVELFGQMALL